MSQPIRSIPKNPDSPSPAVSTDERDLAPVRLRSTDSAASPEERAALDALVTPPFDEAMEKHYRRVRAALDRRLNEALFPSSTEERRHARG